MRVEPGDENYDAMYNLWKREGGVELNYGGFDWIVVKDGDKIVFCRTNSASGVDAKYSSSSVK